MSEGQSPDWGDRWQDEVLREAAERLPEHVYRYFVQGAREGVSAAEAPDSWRSLRLAPRVLRDVSSVSTHTSWLGTDRAHPIGIAPTSMKTYADPDADVAMAQAAAATGTLVVVPSNTASLFADIGGTGADWWLQLYLTEDRGLCVPMLRRARDAGASAVVLTVDTPVVGTKYDDDDSLFEVHPERVNHGHASRDRSAPGAAHARDLSPRDIAWIGEASGLPVVVKGVLRPDDARRAVQHGATGIYVSNHGGRQLDRAVAPARVLEAIVSSVGPQTEVYVDGGVRHGTDVLAAIALGARGVFVGRLPLLGLAARRRTGAETVMHRLESELVEAMTLAGCAALSQARGVVATDDAWPVFAR